MYEKCCEFWCSCIFVFIGSLQTVIVITKYILTQCKLFNGLNTKKNRQNLDQNSPSSPVKFSVVIKSSSTEFAGSQILTGRILIKIRHLVQKKISVDKWLFSWINIYIQYWHTINFSKGVNMKTRSRYKQMCRPRSPCGRTAFILLFACFARSQQ